MTSGPMQIAIIGLDHWYAAFAIAQAAAVHSEVDLVAIADPDTDRAQILARRSGVSMVMTEVQELLRNDTIDAVASFVSVDQNPEICVAAARSGKHILSVKPAARTVDEAAAIVQAVQEAGVQFFPYESRNRLSPRFRLVKSWITEGRLGKVVRANFFQEAGLPQRWEGEEQTGWFTDPGRAPGGGWIDHAIYNIDTLRWLLDDEVGEISGQALQLKYPALQLEDYGIATVRMRGGVLATVEVTWLAPPRGGRTQWNIVGTEGAVSYDSLTDRLSVVGAFPPFTGWVHTTQPAGQVDEIGHWAAVMRGDEQPVATVVDAWHNVAACRAFYDAAAAGQPLAPDELHPLL